MSESSAKTTTSALTATTPATKAQLRFTNNVGHQKDDRVNPVTGSFSFNEMELLVGGPCQTSLPEFRGTKTVGVE